MADTGGIPYRWNGEAMQPLYTFADACAASFTVGQVYRLVEIKDRSDASQGHYFACIKTAWLNLPEWYGTDFPTPESLRKHALIRAGWCNSQQFIAGNVKEAQRLAVFMRPLYDYAMITVNGLVVTILTAKSQSKREMPKGDFESSKSAVLDILAAMIGVSVDELREPRST